MRVAVVQGGASSEAEVSRKSARAVSEALRRAGHETVAVELDRSLPAALLEFSPDVVFPAVHGSLGEDGCLQGLLEVLEIPYVGSDVRASALAADKVASKVFFRNAGLQLAGERALSHADQEADPAALFQELRVSLGESLIIKPAQGGSTIGIERLLRGATPEDFTRALDSALRHDPIALAETYIEGQELTCSVLEDDEEVRALPVTLIRSEATEWYDFESKYAPGGSTHLCPAPLDDATTRKIQEVAVRAHQLLGARDLSRSDFILTESGEAYLLELNTLPGMTETSLFPEAAAADGLDFPSMADLLVRRALSRGVRARSTGRPLPGS